jgi:hypothetical protein
LLTRPVPLMSLAPSGSCTLLVSETVTRSIRSGLLPGSLRNRPRLQRFNPPPACAGIPCGTLTFTLLGVTALQGFLLRRCFLPLPAENLYTVGRPSGFIQRSSRHLHNQIRTSPESTRLSNPLKTWYRILRSDTVAAPPGLSCRDLNHFSAASPVNTMQIRNSQEVKDLVPSKK